MSDEEECECPECPAGLPGWLATFADLMSLLMCFFVLLLSFAEMDVLKFKRLAGSMREAFGVQNQVDVNDIPKGTSVIAQEFSPGKPEPTPIQTVMQHTTEITQATLEVMCEAEVEKAIAEECPPTQPTTEEARAESQAVMVRIQEQLSETENNALEMAQRLESAIKDEQVEIETKGRKIVIRVQEKGSFESGSADLRPAFLPVLESLAATLKSMEGDISVEGHTDSIPIRTARFPTNWHLSSARALEVATGLMEVGNLDPQRFTVVGYAETRPLVPNDTPENRALNRRVEIVLQQPVNAKLKADIEKVRHDSPGLLKGADVEGFELAPDDIF